MAGDLGAGRVHPPHRAADALMAGERLAGRDHLVQGVTVGRVTRLAAPLRRVRPERAVAAHASRYPRHHDARHDRLLLEVVGRLPAGAAVLAVDGRADAAGTLAGVRKGGRLGLQPAAELHYATSRE